jgi:hypothetical protein
MGIGRNGSSVQHHSMPPMSLITKCDLFENNLSQGMISFQLNSELFPSKPSTILSQLSENFGDQAIEMKLSSHQS